MLGLGLLLIWETARAALPSESWRDLKRFYEDIHQHPELSGEEARTAALVVERLRTLGLEVHANVGGHGVVGVLKNGDGPVSLVRAELDALPIHEETRLKYKSVNAGKMHACGHDFHLAAVLGAVEEMALNRKDWKGTLVFVAQPSEEINKGAEAVVSDTVFKKVPRATHVLALHTSGLLEAGKISITPGFALAAVDAIDVTFKGRGTHGAMPEAGVDPFIMTAEFILKLQTLVGREKSATEPVVVSVGAVHGGNKRNIIPEEVKISLTVRSYAPEVRAKIKMRIREIAFGISKTNGAPDPSFVIRQESEPTFNDPAFALKALGLLRSAFGEDAVSEGRPAMVGEDFGAFARVLKARSLYFVVGVAVQGRPKVANHSPQFAPDFSKNGPLAVRAMVSVLRDLHHTH